MASTPRRKPQTGPAILSYGFRPFFLGGALYAALAMLVWLPQYFGVLMLGQAFQPLVWHTHEMLFGFVPAVVAGFLLTAVPNWTGRLPLQGRPLLVLVLVWLAGRVAIAVSAYIGWVATMLVDVAFLALLGAAMGREIVAGKNWRNLRVLGVVALIATADVIFHVEAMTQGKANYGLRLGLAAAAALLMLIGGRIVPSFTRNWLARLGAGRLPIPFDRFDAISMGVAGFALACWVLAPENAATGALLLIGGGAQAARLWRWAPERTGGEALVWVLHAAYAFVPLGFFMAGIAALAPAWLAPSAALHAWGIGAVGGMTLAVMTRATRGHTGRALASDRATRIAYVAVFVAALARLVAGVAPGAAFVSIHIAAGAWILATGAFLYGYAPMLTQPRKHA